MKIKHTDPEISEENPFAECKLERKQYAEVLSDIVKNYADGFVLAINNEWGTGKTTFVKMWQQLLKNEGFQTVYFNAWENDFDNSPMVAIISELKKLTKTKNDKIFKSVLKKGAILAKNILPSLLKVVAQKYTNTDLLTDAVENAMKGTVEIFEKEIDNYIVKKQTILEFKEELEKFIKETGVDKPLVFIVDELDRCRPDYAVEVLEQIKHLFSVRGIVFVLSIDKKHLASSIKGFYGSESINTDEYLRRFIDLEYSIPKPSMELFCDYLYEYYSFSDFGRLSGPRDSLRSMAELMSNKLNTTLRQQEKIFALTRLVVTSFNPNERIVSSLLFILIYLKTIENDFYEAIKNKKFSLQELCDKFENLFPSNLTGSFSFIENTTSARLYC